MTKVGMLFEEEKQAYAKELMADMVREMKRSGLGDEQIAEMMSRVEKEREQKLAVFSDKVTR